MPGMYPGRRGAGEVIDERETEDERSELSSDENAIPASESAGDVGGELAKGDGSD
jgi:hypothetical protein